MGTQFGEAEDFGIGMVVAQTDELLDKFSTGEAGLDDEAVSEVSLSPSAPNIRANNLSFAF